MCEIPIAAAVLKVFLIFPKRSSSSGSTQHKGQRMQNKEREREKERSKHKLKNQIKWIVSIQCLCYLWAIFVIFFFCYFYIFFYHHIGFFSSSFRFISYANPPAIKSMRNRHSLNFFLLFSGLISFEIALHYVCIHICHSISANNLVSNRITPIWGIHDTQADTHKLTNRMAYVQKVDRCERNELLPFHSSNSMIGQYCRCQQKDPFDSCCHTSKMATPYIATDKTHLIVEWKISLHFHFWVPYLFDTP